MIERIKKPTRSLNKLQEHEEIRAVGRAVSRAAVHAAKEFVKVFPREYDKERQR